VLPFSGQELINGNEGGYKFGILCSMKLDFLFANYGSFERLGISGNFLLFFLIRSHPGLRATSKKLQKQYSSNLIYNYFCNCDF
jgi:hypothetical protein